VLNRVADLLLSAMGLLLCFPLLLCAALFIWVEDRKNPFYFAPRIGKSGIPFRMIKLRTMVVGADKLGAASTAGDDQRITRVGGIIRKFKLDELTQLWNVLVGEMSLVGPRPNVPCAVEDYTENEKSLLLLRPGITDFSSIVFSDEGEILRGYADPDAAYEALIRPWKSKLGLVYVKNHSVYLYLQLILMTLLSIPCHECALQRVVRILSRLGVEDEVLRVASRKKPLAQFVSVGSPYAES